MSAPVLSDRPFVEFDDAHLAQEQILVEHLKKFRRSARGKDMVGSREIIAHGFGRATSQKHRARAVDRFQKFVRVFGGDLQMLGGDLVGEFARRAHIFHQNHAARRFPAMRARCLCAGEIRSGAPPLRRAFLRTAASSVRTMARERQSCSACDNTSAATNFSFCRPSAMIKISLGPGEHVRSPRRRTLPFSQA